MIWGNVIRGTVLRGTVRQGNVPWGNVLRGTVLESYQQVLEVFLMLKYTALNGIQQH